MSRKVWAKIGLTGGTTNDLDGIDGNNLSVNDLSFVTEGSTFFVYVASTDGSTETSPNVITPDNNPGSWAWKLQKSSTGGATPAKSVVIKSTDYTVTSTDDIILLNGAGSTIDCIVPLSTTVTGREYNIKCIDDTNNVNIRPSGTQVIDASTVLGLAQWDNAFMIPFGKAYYLL